MKKSFIYALSGAIAFIGTASFTACSSSDEIVNNPDYNPENNAVKTQFTIALPSNVANPTRQSGDIVQSTEAITGFRGMDQIKLYPFTTTGEAGADPVTSGALPEAVTLKGLIKPSSSTGTNTIPAYTTAGTGLLENSNAVLYNDVIVPVSTGSFLFYGKAIDSGTEKFVNGSLDMTTGSNVSDINFSHTKIYSSGSSAVGDALVAYLSSIAQATNWSDCSNSNSAHYNKFLGNLYDKFVSLKAGSSLDVQAAVQDLYTYVKDGTDPVSVAITKKILDATYVSNVPASGETNPATITFKANLGNSFTAGSGKTIYFPYDINLPDGAALLEFNTTNKTFSQKSDGSGNTGSITAKYTDYVYPASLYYYGNSGIKVSTATQMDKYNGTNNWNQILTYYTSGNTVQTSTQSVAILDPIEYGVGRLDMTIKTAANTLYDKNGDAYDASAGFAVTGVLIGGQKAVGYDFTPITTSTAVTIYDNIQKSQTSELTATTTASPVNYTLALETEANTSIYVAVELINKGAPFLGADGIVPSGCKFYLLALLDPSAENNTEGNKVNGVTNTGNKVFKQDYKTIADFTIKAGTADQANSGGLGGAYNTIPDLRTPELELGLSVNLQWKEGITFTLDI